MKGLTLAVLGLVLVGANPPEQELASLSLSADTGVFRLRIVGRPDRPLDRYVAIDCVARCTSKASYHEEISETPWALWASPFDKPIILVVLASGSSNIVKGFKVGSPRVVKVLECASRTLPKIAETSESLTVRTEEAVGAGSQNLQPFVWSWDGTKFVKERMKRGGASH